MAGAAIAGSVGEALSSAVDALAAAGVQTPRLDAEVLLAQATGLDRARLIADPDAGLAAGAARQFGEGVRRRLRREPLAYVLGRKGFRRIELAVDRRVLVPRPESELLVELALELSPRRALDVGTGSGAIALAIADELPQCEVTATDASAAALEVARANAARLGLAARVEFVAGTLPPSPEGTGFELIVANLPYVAETEWPSLEPEVTEWEPREALLAGADGLDAYRELTSTLGLQPRPASPGAVGLEVGQGQAPAVADLLEGAGYGNIEARPDLAGIERVVVGWR
ncbi:MAG TPA: peptide chain release factor N(5)-glutamine methyltransferase [Solirubrobacterales bacterium]|nr:peptide chain release factor N(5)-glutamine methyltransferase [Solirubrobacterales bacterium]